MYLENLNGKTACESKLKALKQENMRLEEENQKMKKVIGSCLLMK
jgi:hypothetical protein